MKKRILLPLFFVASFWASTASAELITYELSGDVTSTFENLAGWMPGIEVGTPLTMLYTYETSVYYQDPLIIGFNAAVYEIAIGDFTIHGPVYYPLTNPGLTWSAFGMFVDGPFAKDIGDGDYMTLSVPDLQTGTLTFHGLDHGCNWFINGCTDDTPGFTASITSVTQVPDSVSTAPLFVLAIGSLAMLRARRLMSPHAHDTDTLGH